MAKRLFIPCDECGYEEFWQTNFCTQCGTPVPRRALEDLQAAGPPFNWGALMTAIVATTVLLVGFDQAANAWLSGISKDAVDVISLVLVTLSALVIEMVFPQDERFEVTVGVAISIIISYPMVRDVENVVMLTQIWHAPFLAALLGSAIGRVLARSRVSQNVTGTTERTS